MKKEAVDILLQEIPFHLVLIYADEYHAGSPAPSHSNGERRSNGQKDAYKIRDFNKHQGNRMFTKHYI